MTIPCRTPAEPQRTPQRIHRQRTRGWKMPPNSVYVGRPTIFGNPFAIDATVSRVDAVREYRDYLNAHPRLAIKIADELRGRDLACWCALDAPCHADVLLELANA